MDAQARRLIAHDDSEGMTGAADISFVLTLTCEDRVGIVAGVTGFLAEQRIFQFP